MTATHWIAIAAIMAPFINSVLQWWLKERSEKSKTATANPAVNQPRVRTHGESISFAGLWFFFLSNWRGFLIQWVLNFTAWFILLREYQSAAPITRRTVVFVSMTVGAWVFFTLLWIFWRQKSN